MARTPALEAARLANAALDAENIKLKTEIADLKVQLSTLGGKYRALIARLNRATKTPSPALSPEHEARRAKLAAAKAEAIRTGQCTLAV